MGNCGSADAPGIEDEPGARERSYSASGTQVLFDRIDALKGTNAEQKDKISAQLKKINKLEEQLAALTEENETYVKEQEEVHSVVTGFEKTIDKVVEEKESVIKLLRVRTTRRQRLSVFVPKLEKLTVAVLYCKFMSWHVVPQTELAQSNAERKQAIADREELKETLERKEKDIAKLRERALAHQTDRERMLSDHDKQIADLQKELASAYASITEAQSELLSTKASLSVATDKQAKLKLKNVALEDALDELTDKYNRRDTLTRAQAQKQLDQAKEVLTKDRENAKVEVEVRPHIAASLTCDLDVYLVAI